MIEKIEIIGGGDFQPTDAFRKYVERRIGKLDRYLPRTHKKDVIARVVLNEVNRAHGNKYEISIAMEVTGGKVLAARDECSNIFAGIDILEAKMTGQIRRFKTEISPKHSKNPFSRLKRQK